MSAKSASEAGGGGTSKRNGTPWQPTQFQSPFHLFSQRSTDSSSSGSVSRSMSQSTSGRHVQDAIGDSVDDNVEVCMAVCLAAGRIGAAYYDSQYGRVNIFEDVVESYATCDILKALIQHVKPTNVIASAKQDEKVMYHLKSHCVAPVTAAASSSNPSALLDLNLDKPRLTLLRGWDFGYGSCKQRICTVVGNSSNTDGVRGEQRNEQVKGSHDTETRLRAAFAINFDATCMVRAFGALLKYLNLKRLGRTHELVSGSIGGSESGENLVHVDEEPIRASGIYSIKKFTLEKALAIDVITLEALQIFQQQYHPSVYKAGRTGMKEGLSLFNLCNYCRSGPGALEFRRWFLRPVSDIGTLQKRLDAVDYLADDNNDEIVDAMSKTLQQVGHVTAILNRMQLSKASIRDWSSLYKTLNNCCRLGDLLRIREQRPILLTELADSFGALLHETCALLSHIIDFEACRQQNRFVVKPNVDGELDARKAFFERLPEFMAAVAHEEMTMLDLGVDECTIVYMPLLGYLLTLPQPGDCSSETGSLLQNEGLELVFVADRMAHYKSEATKRMDAEFGDVKFKIIDRETSIMLNLQSIVVAKAGALLDAVHGAAQLDCLISLAVAAKTFTWTKPNLLDECVINIHAGRHPLQELVCGNDQFVPNPVQSGGFGEQRRKGEPPNMSSQLTSIRQVTGVLSQLPKVHLLTGPNASGKSIYLKQVGLLAYMAHIGSFIPAAKAEIGMLDGIFTRLRTMDSVSGGFSSFATDMRQMSEAVRQATGRSLVLVDEFGKGTSTDVGAGLLASSLEYWLKKRDECPHVFVCSHLYSVLRLLPPSPFLEYQTMSVLQNGDELVFLYKLIHGSADSSYAAHTALAAGLPTSVIDRAMEVFDNIRSGSRIRRQDMSEQEFQNEYRRMSRVVERFMAMDLEDTSRPLQEALQEIIAGVNIEGGSEDIENSVVSS